MGISGPSGTEALLSSALAALDDILRFLQVRHHLGAEEVEELSTLLKIKLLDNDRAVLRSYRGDSSLKTYLGVVANRVFLDDRRARWGKWRPSALARSLGPLGIEMEVALHRDRRPARDAVSLLMARHGNRIPKKDLESLAEELQGSRPQTPDASGGGRAVRSGEAISDDSAAGRLEREETAARITSALGSILERLEPEDRLMLQMHYRDGLPLSVVARALALDQKRLYRRLEKVHGLLRSKLESAGVQGSDVAGLLGRTDIELSFLPGISPAFRSEDRPENPTVSPSMESCGEDDAGRN